MSFFTDMSDLITGGLTKEEARVVRRAGFLVLWRLGFVMFVCFAMGWFGVIGLAGFARADEVDRKIAVAIQPLSVSIAQQNAAVKQLADAANEQTLALLRVAITDGLVKKCHAPKDETKLIYRRQVDEAQVRYYKLTGAYYPEHSCADL